MGGRRGTGVFASLAVGSDFGYVLISSEPCRSSENEDGKKRERKEATLGHIHYHVSENESTDENSSERSLICLQRRRLRVRRPAPGRLIDFRLRNVPSGRHAR